MNFLNAQKPLVIILKYIGYFTFKIPFDGSLVNSSYQHLFFSVSTSLFLKGCFIFNHFFFLSNVDYFDFEDKNYVSTFVTKFEGYAIFTCFIIILSSVAFYRKTHIEFINTIIELEAEVHALKMTQKTYNESLRKNTLRIVIFHFLFHVSFVTFYIAVIPGNSVLFITLESFSYSFFLFSIILFLKFIQNLVETIGNLVDELDRNFKHFVTFCPFHFYEKEVEDLFLLRYRIAETITLFNESFGNIVLGVFILVLSIVTFESYFALAIYFDAISSSDLRTILNLASNTLFLIPLLTTFAIFGFTCEKVQIKAS